MNGIEKAVTAPVERWYQRAQRLGQFLVYNLGQQKALDNVVQLQRRQTLREIETDLTGLDLGATTPPEAEARAELAAVHEFTKIHGPQTHDQMQAIEHRADPDPFAVRHLERLLDKHAPNPSPNPDGAEPDPKALP